MSVLTAGYMPPFENKTPILWQVTLDFGGPVATRAVGPHADDRLTKNTPIFQHTTDVGRKRV